MKKFLYFFIISLVLFGVFILIGNRPQILPVQSKKLSVVVSFYPLAEFTKQIGGNNIQVHTLIPSGVEPHEFEPRTKDAVAISTARLFIYNGLGIDDWGDRLKHEKSFTNTIFLKMSDEINKKIVNDPHFWLDPTIVQKEIEIIASVLVTIDPLHKNEYLKNKLAYINKLQLLDAEYRSSLSNCANNEIVVSHNAFSYLTKQYGINTFYIAGISPEEEPSLKKLAELSNIARSKNIKYIFFESLISPKLSNTLALEIGAQTLVLNPIEGLTPDDIKLKKDYIKIMRENLSNLRLALSCQ